MAHVRASQAECECIFIASWKRNVIKCFAKFCCAPKFRRRQPAVCPWLLRGCGCGSDGVGVCVHIKSPHLRSHMAQTGWVPGCGAKLLLIRWKSWNVHKSRHQKVVFTINMQWPLLYRYPPPVWPDIVVICSFPGAKVKLFIIPTLCAMQTTFPIVVGQQQLWPPSKPGTYTWPNSGTIGLGPTAGQAAKGLATLVTLCQHVYLEMLLHPHTAFVEPVQLHPTACCQ